MSPTSLCVCRTNPPPSGGWYTGVSPLNPARVIANMLVFRCDVKWGWSYLLAHLAAVGAAVAWVWPVHGLGMYMGGGCRGGSDVHGRWTGAGCA